MTLVEFLLARIAEDEAVARVATPGPWQVDNEIYAETIHAADGFTAVVAGGRWGGEASVFNDTSDALHIARHDPARVLAECEAKRRIVEVASLGWSDGLDAATCRKILEALALPYADHPDYDEAWRP